MRSAQRRSTRGWSLGGPALAGLLMVMLAIPALPGQVLARSPQPVSPLPAHASQHSRIGRQIGAGSPASRGRIDGAALIASKSAPAVSAPEWTPANSM